MSEGNRLQSLIDRLLRRVVRLEHPPTSYSEFIQDRWRYTMIFGFLTDAGVFIAVCTVGYCIDRWVAPVPLARLTCTSVACLVFLWWMTSRVARAPGRNPRWEMLASFLGLGIVLGDQVAALDSAIGIPVVAFAGLTFISAFGIYPARGRIAVARPVSAALVFVAAYMAGTANLPLDQRLIAMISITLLGTTIAALSAVTFDRIFEGNFSLHHALVRAREQADEALKSRSAFLGNMSHEIRTPLNGVIGSISLLKETDLPADVSSDVTSMEATGRSLVETIESVLDLSDQEAGNLEIIHQAFNPTEACREALELASATAGGKEVEFKFAGSEDIPGLVIGDAVRIRQILMNLVGNAVKFTTAGEITIRAEVTGQDAAGFDFLFSVEDTGVGISPDRLDRLFIPYSQADRSTSRRFGGTGLGLTICKNLVEMMGGTISATGKEGEGSKFTISLKLGRPPDEPISAATNRLEDVSSLSSSARILMVEDNTINQTIGSRMLKQLGVRHEIAKDGFEAISACRKRSFDLVLMDCQMPRMDGFDATAVIRELKGVWRSVPIIALTASALAGDRDHALRAGMNDYMTKPYDLAGLRSMLVRWLPATGQKKGTGKKAVAD